MTPTDATDIAKSKLPAWAEPPATTPQPEPDTEVEGFAEPDPTESTEPPDIEVTRGHGFDVDHIRESVKDALVTGRPSSSVLDGTVPPETDPESGEAIHTEVDGQPAVVHQRELRIIEVTLDELVKDLVILDRQIAKEQERVDKIKTRIKALIADREELIWEIKKHGAPEQLGLGVDA